MHKPKKYDLSIIIPTFREENRIARCITESVFFLENCSMIGKFEIIFVADNAGDNTINIIKSYAKKDKRIKLIANKQREGKGGSVKKGMLAARYDIMMFYDVDLSTPLFEITKFLKQIGNHDILIASRGLKESKIEKKWFKIFLSRGFSFLKRVILNIRFKDTQCGFKMFKSKCRPIFELQQIKSSAFDVELLVIARIQGFNVKEIPVTWIDSDMSNFNTTKVIMNFLKETIKIKMNALKGVYKQSAKN